MGYRQLEWQWKTVQCASKFLKFEPKLHGLEEDIFPYYIGHGRSLNEGFKIFSKAGEWAVVKIDRG